MIWNTLKIVGKAARFLMQGHLLLEKHGAQLLDDEQVRSFLSRGNKGLLLDGKHRRLSEKESFQNVLLAARVGVGKTSSYIIPNVLDMAHKQASLAVHDPKGEVRDATSGYLKSKGYRIITYDVRRPAFSYRFNPCILAQNEVELEQVAETLVWASNSNEKDAYWNHGATRILSVLLKCLSFHDTEYFNLPNLYFLMQNFGKNGRPLARWVSEHCFHPDRPGDHSVLYEWKAVITGNEEAIQSFVGIALTALKSLNNRDMRAFFGGSDYDLASFRKERTAIFFITPPENQRYYSSTTSLFFRALFNECMRPEHLSGQSLPVYLLYDEFGNSYVPDFVSVVNTIRGYGVSLSLILQSVSQLAMRYGETEAQVIQGAINTSMCLSASDPITAEYFSKLSGRVVEKRRKRMTDPWEDTKEYNLLNYDEVRRLGDHEGLLISKNRQPVRLVITPYYQQYRWKKATQCAPVVPRNTYTQEPIAMVTL